MHVSSVSVDYKSNFSKGVLEPSGERLIHAVLASAPTNHFLDRVSPFSFFLKTCSLVELRLMSPYFLCDAEKSLIF